MLAETPGMKQGYPVEHEAADECIQSEDWEARTVIIVEGGCDGDEDRKISIQKPSFCAKKSLMRDIDLVNL